MKTEQIAKIVENCDGSPKSLQTAVNRILCDDLNFSVGDCVAVVDDDTSIGGMVGKARIKSFSEDKQWANCSFPDGRVVQVLTNTLYPCGSGE